MHLSPTEYKLLEFLMRRAGRVVSRNAIVDAVWNGVKLRVLTKTEAAPGQKLPLFFHKRWLYLY